MLRLAKEVLRHMANILHYLHCTNAHKINKQKREKSSKSKLCVHKNQPASTTTESNVIIIWIHEKGVLFNLIPFCWSE